MKVKDRRCELILMMPMKIGGHKVMMMMTPMRGRPGLMEGMGHDGPGRFSGAEQRSRPPTDHLLPRKPRPPGNLHSFETLGSLHSLGTP